MKKLILSLLAFLSTVTMQAVKTPDFAYPKQVSSQAEKDLAKALEANDGNAVVDALIRYGIAETKINNDRFPAVIKRVEEVTAEEKNPVTHSLLDILTAQLYLDYYNFNSYNLDRRTSVADPPADITLWSGQQLNEKIRSLYVRALADPEALKAARLADFTDVILSDKDERIFYPTVFDFASATALENWPKMDSPAILQLDRLFIFTDYRVPGVLGKPGKDLMKIANDWVAAHPEPSAPRVEALLKRMEALHPYVADFETDSDNTDERMFDDMMALYHENSSSPYAIEILLKAWDDYDGEDPENEKKLYGILTGFVRHNPAYIRLSSVENVIAHMSLRNVSLNVPSQFAKGRSAKVNLVTDNVNDARLVVYRIPDTFRRDYVSFRDLSGFKTVKSIPVKAEGTVPFHRSVNVDVTIDDYGRYVIVPEFDGASSPSYNLDIVHCSDLTLYSWAYDKTLTAWSVDIADGTPVEGAEITLSDRRKKTLRKENKTSDGDGKVTFGNVDYGSFDLHAVKGDDRYGSPFGQWISEYRNSESRRAEIKTSLPVYHQGDTAEFVAIAYTRGPKSNKVLAGTDIIAILRDANYEQIDTLALRTDDFGRASGSFALPEKGLTGNFSITVIDNADKRWIGQSGFIVSDYKLPTYTVTVDSVLTSGTGAKDVVLKGKAMTYSGFPVADASVKLSLKATTFSFWYLRNSPVFYQTETTTSSDGSFAVTLDDDVLSQSPYSGGGFVADIVVTSAAGENREVSRSFSIGDRRAIVTDLPDAVDAATTKSLDISLTDMLGNQVDGDIRLTFTDQADSDSISFVVNSSAGKPVDIDLSTVPSGKYSLSLTSADADPVEGREIVIYRTDDAKSPVDDAVWLPIHHVSADAATRTAEIMFAAMSDKQNILMIVDSASGSVERKWIDHHAGMNTVEVRVPDDVNRLTVTFIGTHDLQSVNDAVIVMVPDPKKQLKVSIDSFRDKINPGSDEKITVSVTDAEGTPRSSALILDMYSKAIDAIATSSWRMTVPAIGIGGFMPSIDIQSYYQRYINIRSIFNRKSETLITVPELNLYGKSFGIIRLRGGAVYGYRSTKLMAKEASFNSYAVSEGADEEEEEATAATSDIADAGNGVLQEVVAMSYGVTGSVSSLEEAISEEGADKDRSVEIAYRPSEIPLAFFAPMLSTGSDGKLTYSFTVPNANTTWVLNALAYDCDMNTATAIREAIASKPIMTEPNLPRFIRRGDKAQILVSVMNNTDSAATVTTTFELVNPIDMSVISEKSVDKEIPARESAIASFGIDADNDLQALLVRVRSTAGNYSDGEQTLLPILESTQPVIDSETFYLPVDCKEFTTSLPAGKENSTTTLSFCENPTWEVVSALPGLRAETDQSSISAAASLFSAAIARGILDSNPAIEPALRQWLDSAKDNGTLLSMLDRNEDLKQLLLASTPWVGDAASDNERLTRLALLFDRKSISSAVDKAIKTLSDMERDNGGWAWIQSSDKPSAWATYHILHEIGHLKDLGYLPSDKKLDDMTRRALKFLDGEVARDFRKYPKSTYLEYVYVRGMFPETVRSTGAQAATAYTIQRIVRGWKNYSPSVKAAAAIILHRGKYPSLSVKVIESLREFAEYDPRQGMWWPSLDGSSWWSLTANAQTSLILDAFNEIVPDSPDIDRIRQWLILGKQVQDWGNSVNTSAVIASILKCGSSWLNRPGDVSIAVDGKTIVPDEADRLTGKFIMNIDGGDTLSISRLNEGPAWGAVISRYTGIMSAVEAKSLPELSITKETLVRRGEDWIPTDSITLGDVAKVRLTLRSTRDMDYITVTDQRAACLEPVIQTPRGVYCDGLYFYLENRDAVTNLFVDRMPRGQYIIEYEMNVNNAGVFSSGLATVQSQYTPEMTAHSAGTLFTVAAADKE